jgi:hypothetical protein
MFASNNRSETTSRKNALACFFPRIHTNGHIPKWTLLDALGSGNTFGIERAEIVSVVADGDRVCAAGLLHGGARKVRADSTQPVQIPRIGLFGFVSGQVARYGIDGAQINVGVEPNVGNRVRVGKRQLIAKMTSGKIVAGRHVIVRQRNHVVNETAWRRRKNKPQTGTISEQGHTREKMHALPGGYPMSILEKPKQKR